MQLLWGAGPINTTAATFDQSYAIQGVTYSTASYDLHTGQLSLWRKVGGVSWTFVHARDAYDVQGTAPGTPVHLIAQLSVDGVLESGGCGGTGCGGWLTADVRHGADATADSVSFPNIFAAGTVPMHETLALPITIVAGSPELLEYDLTVLIPAGGNAGGSATGQIVFTGLPPGVTVTSCQGITSATPVQRTSWGVLKALYR